MSGFDDLSNPLKHIIFEYVDIGHYMNRLNGSFDGTEYIYKLMEMFSSDVIKRSGPNVIGGSYYHRGWFRIFCGQKRLGAAKTLWKLSLIKDNDIIYVIESLVSGLILSEIRIDNSSKNNFSKWSMSVLIAIIASGISVSEFVNRYIVPTNLIPQTFIKHIISYFNKKLEYELKHNRKLLTD